MADPLSVTFGVLGLAGLFTTITDIWGFVDAGRGYSADFSYFRTRLENQRERFLQWGTDMGFGSEAGYDKRLDEPMIRLRIESTLHHIKLVFSDTDKLVKSYGLCIEERDGNAVMKLGSSHVAWKMSYKRFRTNLRRNQKTLSFAKVTRWSIKDSAKFKNMIDQLSSLLNDLADLTKDFVTKNSQVEPLRVIHLDQRLGHQQEMTLKSGYAETVTSSINPAQMRATYRTPAETNVDGPNEPRDISSDSASILPASIRTTFYTGKSHQTRSTIAGTTAGDNTYLAIGEIIDQVEGLRECVVCGEDFPVQSNQTIQSITSMCKHDLAICMPCITRHIRSDLEHGCDRVRCPECLAILNEDDVRLFADLDTLTLYREMKRRTGSDLQKEESPSTTNDILQWNDFIDRNTKKCPGCSAMIEKAAGCDHMICRLCRTEFCWSCLVNYAFINKEGHNRHRLDCPYYIDPSIYRQGL